MLYKNYNVFDTDITYTYFLALYKHHEEKLSSISCLTSQPGIAYEIFVYKIGKIPSPL